MRLVRATVDPEIGIDGLLRIASASRRGGARWQFVYYFIHCFIDWYVNGPGLLVDPPIIVQQLVFFSTQRFQFFPGVLLDARTGRYLRRSGHGTRGRFLRCLFEQNENAPDNYNYDGDTNRKSDHRLNDEPDVRLFFLVADAAVRRMMFSVRHQASLSNM